MPIHFTVVARRTPSTVRYGSKREQEITLPPGTGQVFGLIADPGGGGDGNPVLFTRTTGVLPDPGEGGTGDPIFVAAPDIKQRDMSSLLSGISGDDVRVVLVGVDDFSLDDAVGLVHAASARGLHLTLELGQGNGPETA